METLATSSTSNDPTALVIRKATQYDSETIYSFLCELEETTLDPTAFEAVFQHNLTNPSVHYLVSEEGGEVVGFISCHVQYLLHHTGKVGEIQELYVKPAYRGRRIGQRLMAALDELAHHQDFVNLEVTTNQKRTDTVRFYEQLAYRPTHYKLVKPLLP